MTIEQELELRKQATDIDTQIEVLQIRKQIERLKLAARGPSFVSRKYGEGIRQQIRYLEGRKVTSSGDGP